MSDYERRNKKRRSNNLKQTTSSHSMRDQLSTDAPILREASVLSNFSNNDGESTDDEEPPIDCCPTQADVAKKNDSSANSSGSATYSKPIPPSLKDVSVQTESIPNLELYFQDEADTCESKDAVQVKTEDSEVLSKANANPILLGLATDFVDFLTKKHGI